MDVTCSLRRLGDVTEVTMGDGGGKGGGGSLEGVR